MKKENRRQESPRQRRTESAIYSDGKKTLFVPSLTMWEFGDFAAKAGCKRGVPSLVKAGGDRVTTGGPYRWLALYADEPWFRAWLLAGANVPKDVHVATRKQVERATAAWNPRLLMQAIGRDDGGIAYCNWFAERRVPVEPLLAWQVWLYSGRNPA